MNTREDYMGSKSTLCTGCGHDSISNHLITALYQSGIDPQQIIKLSGIGCSSKSIAYFLTRSHGFNSIHGRMASVATGAKLANSKLLALGISGDGDTASIGLSGFSHMIRRNLPITYLIENNGVYGLTKGQFSATANQNSSSKSGLNNPFTGLDLCTLALNLGATFVARSFSGDAKQLVPLLQAAFKHQGTAIIDIISPCVTFNNHPGSTRSYDQIKVSNVNLQSLGFIQPQDEKTADYQEGAVYDIALNDGSILRLKKIIDGEHNVHDSLSAINLIEKYNRHNQLLTGLLYIDTQKKSLLDLLNLADIPLSNLSRNQLIPSENTLRDLLLQFK